MALTAEDLRDLVELLRAHPEWREVLWALLASEEILRLPADLAAFRAEAERRFAELAEAIRRLSEAFIAHRQEFLAYQAQNEARFAELNAAVRALMETQRQLVETQRQLVDTQRQLVEAQGRTEANLQRLSEAFIAHRQEFLAYQAQTEARFAELAEAVRRLSEEFAAHRQEFLEHRREFLEHRAETDRRFAELAEAQRRTEESLRRLSEEFAAHRQEFLEYRAETDRRFAELAEAVRVLAQRVDRVERRLEDHSRDLGELKSMRLEALYRENPGLFRPLLRRAAILPDSRKLEILEEAEAAGRITGEEADRAAPLDLLVEGFHRREDRRVYLAVEISWLGSTEDVARAAERAGLLARALEAEVIPVVAAKELTAPARGMARERGVWWLQDGRAFAPEEIPEEEEEPGSEAA